MNSNPPSFPPLIKGDVGGLRGILRSDKIGAATKKIRTVPILFIFRDLFRACRGMFFLLIGKKEEPAENQTNNSQGDKNKKKFIHIYSPLSKIVPMIMNIIQKITPIFSGFFRVFFMPVRVENNRTKNYYSQCSTTKENIETKFVHLGSSSSTKYAIVNVAIQNINPPIKTPILNPCAEINCPSTNAAKVSFPTSYKFFDKLVCFIKYIIQQIKIFVKQRSGFICRIKLAVTIMFLLFTFHLSLFTPSAEARFLFFGKKKTQDEIRQEKIRKNLKDKDLGKKLKAIRKAGGEKGK